MVVCKNENEFCAFTVFFGSISILFLILVVTPKQDAVLLKFNKNKQIKVIFMARYLCIIMIIEYFIPAGSRTLFFLKEYVLLLSYCVTAYYFIFQAGFLLFKYKFYRYLLYSSLSLTAFFLISLIVYFLASLLFTESIPCNSPPWIYMRSLGLVLSVLSIIISFWISVKVEQLSKHLNNVELKDRMFYLWLFIIVLFICNLVKFSESLTYFLADIPNCFYFLSFEHIFAEILYGVLIFLTDYSIVVCILFMFLWSIRTKNKENSQHISMIVEVTHIQSPKITEAFNDLKLLKNSGQLDARRRSSTEAMDDFMSFY